MASVDLMRNVAAREVLGPDVRSSRIIVAERLDEDVDVRSSTLRDHSNQRRPSSALVASVNDRDSDGHSSACSAFMGNVAVITNNCQVAPVELPGVVTVSASGVNQLASYSNVGNNVDVTAPGGDVAQTPGVTYGRILAGWSRTDQTGQWEALAAAGRGVEDANGNRWVWISGTSLASPHVAGVAALIRQLHPGWSPSAVAAAIRRAASPMTCPTDWPADDERQCTGGSGNTSFYGAGMANALAAVSR